MESLNRDVNFQVISKKYMNTRLELGTGYDGSLNIFSDQVDLYSTCYISSDAFVI